MRTSFKYFAILLIAVVLLADAANWDKRSSGSKSSKKYKYRYRGGSSSSGGRVRTIWRSPSDPCRRSSRPACGVNAYCVSRSGRAICVCITGTYGDPYSVCRVSQPKPRPQPRPRPRPGNPCKNVECGTNANCDRSDGHCRCNAGYRGNPNYGHSCVRPNPCGHVTCGINGQCIDGRCVCMPGFFGNPNYGHRCVRPSPPDACQSVICGLNAHCVSGRCICDSGCRGNPYSGCSSYNKG